MNIPVSFRLDDDLTSLRMNSPTMIPPPSTDHQADSSLARSGPAQYRWQKNWNKTTGKVSALRCVANPG